MKLRYFGGAFSFDAPGRPTRPRGALRQKDDTMNDEALASWQAKIRLVEERVAGVAKG